MLAWHIYHRSSDSANLAPASLHSCAPRCGATRSCACCTRRSGSSRAPWSVGRRSTATASTRSGYSRSRHGRARGDGRAVQAAAAGRSLLCTCLALLAHLLRAWIHHPHACPSCMLEWSASIHPPHLTPQPCPIRPGGQPQARAGAAAQQRGTQRRAEARGAPAGLPASVLCAGSWELLAHCFCRLWAH